MHGDRVVVRIERYREDGRAEGQHRPGARACGSRRSLAATMVDASGLGFVTPFDKRLTADIQIPRGEARDAAAGRDGDGRSHALADADARPGRTHHRGARRHQRSRRRHRDHPPQARHPGRAQPRSRSPKRSASAAPSRRRTSPAAPTSAIARSSRSTASTRATSTMRSRSRG